MFRILIATLFASLAVAAEAAPLNQATPGNTYFNRPGADLAAHDAALVQCLGEASRAAFVGSLSPGPGILGASIEDMQKSNIVAANVENCMVVMGWRVVVSPPSAPVAASKPDRGIVRSWLESRVGAAKPDGEVMRVWKNDAELGSTNRTGHAHILSGGASSLSLRSLDPAVPVQPAPAPKIIRLQQLNHPLSPSKFADTPADSALVIFDVRNAGMSHGAFLLRLSSDPQAAPWASDGKAAAIELMNQGPSFTSSTGARLMAFAAPPGRWALTGLSGTYSMLSFCLGAPGFDLKAGDVVFAGRIDFNAEEFGPTLDLDDARAMLNGHPDLAAKLKPADYINGNRSDCRLGQNLFALEVKGAPYAAGYRWGGAADASH